MFGICWRRRDDSIAKYFVRVFGVPFPKNEEERTAIREHVFLIIVEVGREAEVARLNFLSLKEKKKILFRSDLTQRIEELVIEWIARSARTVDERGKMYSKAVGLARRAGFSKADIKSAEKSCRKKIGET